MSRIRYLYAVHAWYCCDHACTSLKTQRVIWICIQVRTDWVYSLFRSDHACTSLKTQRVIWICIQVRTDWVYSLFRSDHACTSLKTQRVIWICIQVRMHWVCSLFRSVLIFEADEGNPLKWVTLKKVVAKYEKFDFYRQISVVKWENYNKYTRQYRVTFSFPVGNCVWGGGQAIICDQAQDMTPPGLS